MTYGEMVADLNCFGGRRRQGRGNLIARTMASLRAALPRPAVYVNDAPSAGELSARATAPVFSNTPRYGKRSGFLPRSAGQFADGGAFPEIHVAQYPPGLGLMSANATEDKSLAVAGVATVTTTATGEASYDSIMTQGHAANKDVHTSHNEMVPKPNNVFERPSEEATQMALAKTKEALLGRIDKKAAVSGGQNAKVGRCRLTPGNPWFSQLTHSRNFSAWY